MSECNVHGPLCRFGGLAVTCRETRPEVIAILRGASPPRPSPTVSPARPPAATRRDEPIRSCLHGDACGCSARYCNWKGLTVRMAAECRDCMAATVLAPPVARAEGWDYTVAIADAPDT